MNERTNRSRRGLTALFLCGALALLPGCTTAKQLVMLPFEVAERTLTIAEKTVDLGIQGVRLANESRKVATERTVQGLALAESGVGLLSDAVRAVANATDSEAGHCRER